MHNASKVKLGGTVSSAKLVTVHNGASATFKAGLAVSLASTSSLSLLKSAGMRIGISLGKDLSNSEDKTSVLREGLGVPLRAHLKRATAVVTISAYANLVSGTADTLQIDGVTFTAQAGAATPGAATFQAATSNNATATSLATQINAHATASTKVYAVASAATVTLYAHNDGAAGNNVGLVYTNNDGNVGITLSGAVDNKLSGGSDDFSDIAYTALGAKAYINDTTGKADINISGFTTISDATYVSAVLTGIDETNVEHACALVDIPGGL